MKKIILLSTLLLLIGCKEKKIASTIEELNVISECIEYIQKNDKESCYLVNPYFNSFSISFFFNSNNKSIINLFNNISKQEFQELQKKIDDKYFKKHSESLENLSSCDKSKNIISFSGIENNMLMGYLHVYPNEMNMENVIDEDYSPPISEVNYFIFLLDKDGKIKEVLKDSIIFN